MKKVSMEIISKTHMENRCTCLLVRKDGRVCAHVIALGLEVIDPQNVPEEPEAPVEDCWPEVSEQGKDIELQVMLPLKVEAAWEKGQVMIGFGALVDGEEILLSALPREVYRLDSSDEELWCYSPTVDFGVTPSVSVTVNPSDTWNPRSSSQNSTIDCSGSHSAGPGIAVVSKSGDNSGVSGSSIVTPPKNKALDQAVEVVRIRFQRVARCRRLLDHRGVSLRHLI